MLSVYKLQAALQESASTTDTVSDVPAYNFIGGLDEAVSEFQYHLMLESVDFDEFTVASDEIMTEAAMTNPDVIETLSENVFTSVIEKAKKFYDKVIGMVKGLIEKIKAYIAGFTGKYSKWVSIMKPKIEAAKNKSLSVSIHKWDESYIMTDLPASIDKIQSLLDIESLDKKNTIDRMLGRVNNVNSSDPKADDVNTVLSYINADLDSTKSDHEKFMDGFVSSVASAVGVSESASIGAVYSGIVTKATGGEKSNLSFGSDLNATTMLTTIGSATKALEAMKKSYEDDLKALSKVRSKLEELNSKLKGTKFDKIAGGESEGKARPSSVTSAARTLYTTIINNNIVKCRMGQDVMSKIHNIDKNQLTSMIGEYMSALSKYAGGKEEKVEPEKK